MVNFHFVLNVWAANQITVLEKFHNCSEIILHKIVHLLPICRYRYIIQYINTYNSIHKIVIDVFLIQFYVSVSAYFCN